ncbi:MAG: hypothetical protein KJ621_12575 [Proteobacteria bacterium]|nr:hypothetical protein [Pseudomonadota bacterium]MBU1742157.1 hypothetical protein [Pseudomonadota bacterium]
MDQEEETMTDVDQQPPPWRAGDRVWVRHGRFLQKKTVSRVLDGRVSVDGRRVPADKLTASSAVDVPEEIQGLRFMAEAFDYRVWGAYAGPRPSDMGLRTGKVLGVLVEHHDCGRVSGRFFAGRGATPADVLRLLWELESGAVSASDGAR